MQERTGLTKSQGEPVILLGNELKIGQQAPDFKVVDNDMNTVTLSAFKGKVVVISSVASLDTSVCDTETRRFNQEAAELGSDVVILTISMDLPFAQKRWCGAAGVDRVITLSDHRDASFGEAYGILIKGLRLLARTIHIVDKDGKVSYIQTVPEISEEPNYDEVLDIVKKLL